jgi:hypothetical protein
MSDVVLEFFAFSFIEPAFSVGVFFNGKFFGHRNIPVSTWHLMN